MSASSTERVIVVSHSGSGKTVKVCGSWEDYDEWIETVDWDDSELRTEDCRVYRAN